LTSTELSGCHETMYVPAVEQYIKGQIARMRPGGHPPRSTSRVRLVSVAPKIPSGCNQTMVGRHRELALILLAKHMKR
jgi:hypothetical protein